MRRLTIATGIAVVVALLLWQQTPEPPPDPAAEAQAIAGAIMCPSEQARDLRGEIRTRLEAGESRAAIEADLVARFGQGVLADPSSLPGGRVAILVPVVLGVAGLALIAWYLRRWTRPRGDAAAPPAPPADEAFVERLEDELARLG